MKAQETVILLFLITMYNKSCIVNSQTIEDNLKTLNAGILKTPIQKGQKYGYYHAPIPILQVHSSSNLQPQRIKLHNNYRSNFFNNPHLFYNKFDADFEKHLNGYEPNNNEDSSNSIEINKRTMHNKGYDDYKTSQTSHVVGPRQIETIQSEHFHKKVPAFDVSGFQSHGHEKHGEVHYHEHKHIHKHEHKQEHVHQHKQKHDHKHVHSQNHKHEHNSKHNHGHEHKHKHKHDHHQQHKHQHHHGHNHHSHGHH